MKKNKVYVYAICKNEEKFVEKWMESMNEADGVYVLDTGSTDKTVELLKKYGAVVNIEVITPWRFDVARNRSLELVPNDADICVCTDLDEVFNPGWRQKLENGWNKVRGCQQAQYTYNWSQDEFGNPLIQFNYNKIHRREGFIWNYPCHEWLSYIGKAPFKDVEIADVVLNHFQDQSKERSSYLNLLKMGVDEDPTDPRMAYYLGREYLMEGKFELCRRTLKKYLELPNATWNEERAAAMRWIADAYFKDRQLEKAKQWYFFSFLECDKAREPYIEYASNLYDSGNHDWPTIFWLCDQAFRITEKSKTFNNEEYAWNFKPHDLMALACYYLKMYELALEHGMLALKHWPDNEQLQSNLEFYRAGIEKGDD